MPLDVGARKSGAPLAIAELGDGSGKAAGGGVGNSGIEEHDGVVLFREGEHDVPTQAEVKGESRGQLDVVLTVEGKRLVAEPQFLRTHTVCRIDGTQQEAGECVPRIR